jgi:hypothetical protein
MNGIMIFWSVIVFFALVAFVVMSAKMLIKGFPELREMFKKLQNPGQRP